MSFVQFLFLCTLPIYLFSWSMTNWFSQPSAQEKSDFMCPHQCGKWGSESIRRLEWQFIQCLYEADRFQRFIESNEDREVEEWTWNPKKYKGPKTPIDPPFLDSPKDFSSDWYQQMLVTNQDSRLVIITDYACHDGWAIFWRIKHIDQPDGIHVGKVFKRKKYIDCVLNGKLPNNRYKFEKQQELEKKHRDDSTWDQCFWRNSVEEGKYKFNNRIDFLNTCWQLEQDLFDEVQEDFFRVADTNPLFKQEMNRRLAQISNQIQEVRNSYNLIFEECQRLHHAPSADYELIMQRFEKGEYGEAIDQLRDLLGKVKLENLETHLASHIYMSKGKAEVEALQYDEAISTLSQAITLNPSNPDAYFERAVAYFETGQFDLSLQDYLQQGKDIAFIRHGDLFETRLYVAGFTKGAFNGICDASIEFLPSVCNSIYGVGNLLWLTVSQPIETPKMLIHAAIDFCDYLRTCDPAELAQLLVPELHELITQWDQLNYDRRGELLGYALGKYGLDILLPVASVKGLKYMKAYHDIKRVDKLCVLQTLAKSPESKEALTQAAVKWSGQRKGWFEGVKLVKDQQTKHIPGSWNYQKWKGKWTHPNPEALLSKYAGKGQKVVGVKGKPGYRERVDFGEIIGYYENDKTKESLLTTVGMIHYSKKGAHIVPAAPKK